MHTCAARVLNQNLWLNVCVFYIIILNKPVALYYKNTHAVIALRNETIIKSRLNLVTGNCVHIFVWKNQAVRRSRWTTCRNE